MTRKESLLTSPCILWATLIIVILQQSTEHLKESWEAVFMGSTVEVGCSVVSDAVTGTKSVLREDLYCFSTNKFPRVIAVVSTKADLIFLWWEM